MSYAIETHGLSKYYGTVHAVDSIDLRVRSGEIYAFLGLNGAGKTTTIRLLLGMVKPTAGSVRVLGKAVGPYGRGPWKDVGHLVEEPAAYPELSVRENLEIHRRLHGINDRRAVARVIDQLKLVPYAERKAGALSTGNLKRLGLARALLHQPPLLILDEPANGLDPAGVVEIRKLLSDLAHQQGVTVFMSSHILTEVDRLANRIGIIHQGRLIEELEALEIEARRSPRLHITVRDVQTAARLLDQAGYAVNITGDTLVLSDARAITAPEDIAVLLVNGGLPPSRLSMEQEDLEEHFLRLTGAKP
jgi:ABC-2 type transport system ATP-binding protein